MSRLVEARVSGVSWYFHRGHRSFVAKHVVVDDSDASEWKADTSGRNNGRVG